MVFIHLEEALSNLQGVFDIGMTFTEAHLELMSVGVLVLKKILWRCQRINCGYCNSLNIKWNC